MFWFKQPIKKEYEKATKNLTSVDIQIFASTKENPLTITEADLSKLASIKLPIGKHQEIIVVGFCFFNTLITVFTYPEGEEDQKKKIKLEYHATQKETETPTIKAVGCLSWIGFWKKL